MKQSTTRLNFAWLASVSGTSHVELDKTPQIEYRITKSRRSPKILVAEFVFFFRFIRIKCQNACLVIHFSINQMQIESHQKKLTEYHKKKFLVLIKMGPNSTVA